jgi:hypothetical protein
MLKYKNKISDLHIKKIFPSFYPFRLGLLKNLGDDNLMLGPFKKCGAPEGTIIANFVFSLKRFFVDEISIKFSNLSNSFFDLMNVELTYYSFKTFPNEIDSVHQVQDYSSS